LKEPVSKGKVTDRGLGRLSFFGMLTESTWAGQPFLARVRELAFCLDLTTPQWQKAEAPLRLQ